jgi:serine phosphatase RsbU (regulator of sigma subunit)/PAS domain-containing protein
VSAVRRLEGTATGARAVQRLAGLAQRLLGVQAAQVSLIGEVETVVAGAGLPPGMVGRQHPRQETICAVTAALAPEPLVIRDTRRDPRLAGLPLVAAGPVVSYLGAPLVGSSGVVVGALCVFGPEPREWSESDVVLLRQLADSVATELELSALAKEFEASRLRSDLAIDAAGIGSFDYDLLTGDLTWDDRLIELFGYDRESFEGTIEAFLARLHPDDVHRTEEAMQASIDRRGSLDIEYRIVLPTGETRWVQGRGRVLTDDGGMAVRLLGAAYDTTDQRHGDARVSRVLEAMNAAFCALDRTWHFTYVNAEAERLLARGREQLIGGSVWELFPAAVGSDFERNYRGAAASGEERVFEAYYPPPLDSWYEVRAWPGPDGLSVYFLDVTERRAAQERARRSADRLSLIADISAAMSLMLVSGYGEAATLQRVAEAVVPLLGDWVILSLIDEDGRMRDVASWHREESDRELVARYAQLRLASIRPDAPVIRALASGQLLTVDDVGAAVGATLPPGEVSEVFWALSPRTAVALPLAARGRTLGALSIYRSPDRSPADADDVAAAKDVAERVALAVDNSRLYEQQRRLAEGLQRSLLTAPPEPDHAEIVVRYRPAMEAAQVGGDWYDAFLQPSGATMVVIGDVVGHDTEAAAAMGQLRGMLRGIAYRHGISPAEVLTELDAAIHGLQMGTMATAAIARVEQTPEEKAAGLTRLRWSNAGHPAPLVLHHDGRIEELSGARAELMLGVDPAAHRTDSVTTVRRGSTLFLYTDGLVEGRDLPLDEGVARLRAALAELADEPLSALCDAVIERLRPEGLQDDVALVAIRLHRQDRPRPAEAGPERLPPGGHAEQPLGT